MHSFLQLKLNLISRSRGIWHNEASATDFNKHGANTNDSLE